MRAPLGIELRGVDAPAVHTGRHEPRICTARCRALLFFAIRSAESSLLLTSAWAVTAPILQWRRLFYAGVPERITPDRGALLQISRKSSWSRSERPLLIASA